eukprot:scaffold39015_cov72-Phaeocystis_antarctica.AAC.5
MLSTLPLHAACYKSDTTNVKQLLDDGEPVDAKAKDGWTALMCASDRGHTEVVKLLLDWNASVNEKKDDGWTALMKASRYGRTEVVKLLLDGGAQVEEMAKGGLTALQDGRTALLLAIRWDHTEVVKLLLDKGASVNDENKYGSTALVLASHRNRTEVVKLLLDKGARVDEQSKAASMTALVAYDENQLARMAASQVHRLLPQEQGTDLMMHAQNIKTKAEATGTAVLQLVRLAGFARARASKLRSSDTRSADDHQVLFARLQLAAAACVQNDEIGEVRLDALVQKVLSSDDGRNALEYAVQIDAKGLFAQPVVQKYIKVAWRGEWEVNDFGSNFFERALTCVFLFVFLLLQLLFVLPLVALMPALESWLDERLGDAYFLGLPVVKFGLECSADLALALALTVIPAADLATAPVAPLLLGWIGSGLLWEVCQLMGLRSSDAKSQLTRVYDRLVAYWDDNINRVDATALIFSLAALVMLVSAGDSEDTMATTHGATSLRVAAVFLLWFRIVRVLLVLPKFGPLVLMFFRMLFDDVLYFLVLVIFLLVAFAASWTVLLEPQSSIAGCAGELGGVDFLTTLLRIFEGALTGSDYFECARNSTNSPVAAWVVTAVYVTLTAVLGLNMLIAMCAAATIHSAIA